MKTADFDFDLPDDHIALRPAEPRDSARLLVVKGGVLEDRIIRDLPGFLEPGDALVFNDTRVIPARLSGVRQRVGPEGETLTVDVEATLHHRDAPDVWSAFMKPGKRIKAGDRIRFGAEADGACLLGRLDATVVEKGEDGLVTLRFDLAGPMLDEAIRDVGVMPLPPYIAAKRAEDDRDRSDYQTMFAHWDGSVAAPTAGLHFTPSLMAALAEAGIATAGVTLHVGAGTFQPVRADDTDQHVMHAEWGEVPQATAAAIAAAGRVVSIGTTALRLLESVARTGPMRAWAGETDIFITPGFQFRVVDLLLTNFHLPRSTLFMLVAAFAGLERIKAAYAHAVGERYRFYSYGDCCLLRR
jgi:S-adenosylmethionine:tRNA ribosyltransferase-isomerase